MTGALVFNVAQEGARTVADFHEPLTGTSTRVRAKAAVFCAPRFVAAHVLEAYRREPPAFARSFEYSPWMVANLTLREPLAHRRGAPLSWDNVIYGSPSLGYVNACNQKIERFAGRAVLTYYRPLTEGAPKAARQAALARSYEDWTREILSDLSTPHPDLASKLSHLDVWLWGHGMIRPTPGFIWGADRRHALQPEGGVFFAHTDMSGISIFEEAFHHGSTAAVQAFRYARGAAHA
jgi:hypothetical protein